MGCIYQDYMGLCNMWDEDIEMNGVEGEGICVCSDDPDPGDTCEVYESDDPEEDCDYE